MSGSASAGFAQRVQVMILLISEMTFQLAREWVAYRRKITRDRKGQRDERTKYELSGAGRSILPMTSRTTDSIEEGALLFLTKIPTSSVHAQGFEHAPLPAHFRASNLDSLQDETLATGTLPPITRLYRYQPMIITNTNDAGRFLGPARTSCEKREGPFSDLHHKDCS